MMADQWLTDGKVLVYAAGNPWRSAHVSQHGLSATFQVCTASRQPGQPEDLGKGLACWTMPTDSALDNDEGIE